MNFHNFEKTITIPYSRCDFNERLMLSDVLREAQDISMEHCDSVGVDSAFYLKHKRTFLLAKIGVTVNRYPQGGEKVRLFTQPYQPTGPQYQRFTYFYDSQDNLLIQVDSRWVLIDTDTHRISRDPKDKELFVFDQGPKPSAIKPSPLESLAEIAQVPLQYSMVDRNHHLNNAAYADLVCNCVKEQLYAGKQIKEMRIFYHNEALYDKTLTILQATQGESAYLKGRVDDKDCFECNILLADTLR